MIVASAFQVAGAVPVPAAGSGEVQASPAPTPAGRVPADRPAPAAEAATTGRTTDQGNVDAGAAQDPARTDHPHTQPSGIRDTAVIVTPGDAAAPSAATAAPAPAPTGDPSPATVAPAASVGQPAPMTIGAHAPQTPGLGGALLALLLVLGLILGLAWLLRRLPGSGLRAADGLRVVASIPLGAKERAAVVQVGEEQLLLGIGPGGVRTLHRLPAPLPEPAPVAMPSLRGLPDFKQLLAQRLRRDS